MTKLTAKARKKLPKSAFALPGGRYPIHDRRHAVAALVRVAQHGSPEEQAKVKAAVARRYPSLPSSKKRKTKADKSMAIEASGDIELGSYGSKWKHGWIPLNAAATALKTKQLRAGGSHQSITHAGHSILVARTHRGTHGALVVNKESGASHYIEHDSPGGAGRAARSFASRQSASVPSPGPKTKAPDGYKLSTKRDSFTTHVHTKDNEYVGSVEKRAEGHYVAHHESTTGGNASETSYKFHDQAVNGLVNQHQANREADRARAEERARQAHSDWVHEQERKNTASANKTTSEGVAKVTTTARTPDSFTDTASNGKQYDHNAVTGLVHRRDGAQVGTMHQNADGTWKIEGVSGSLPAHNVKTRSQAINGLAVAHDLYLKRSAEDKAKKEADAEAVKSGYAEDRARREELLKVAHRVVMSQGGRSTKTSEYSAKERLLREVSGTHEEKRAKLAALVRKYQAGDLQTEALFRLPVKPSRAKATKTDTVRMVEQRANLQRITEANPLDLNTSAAANTSVREGMPVTHGGRAGHVIGVYGQTFDTFHPPTQGQNGHYTRHEIRTRKGRKELVSTFAGHSNAKAS